MVSQVAQICLKPDMLLLVLIGVVVGNVFGCVPGLNAPIAIALALPVTFIMNTYQSMALIMGLYMGCVSGGLVSAILLRVPGTAANVATCFDGYPMAQQGRATEALSIGSFASLFGGIFSSFCLLVFAPLLANIALAFGPWEFFGTAMLSLVLVCCMSNGKVIKGFIAVCVGLLLKSVGLSPVDGVALRYTFGSISLESGFNQIVIIIAVFALPEIFSAMQSLKEQGKLTEVKKRHFPSWRSIKQNTGIMLMNSIIGTLIGILPGMGGGTASLVSYEQTKKFSKHPEKFGTGCEEGIYCCESANNATTGGALIPLLALGVPGDTASAVIMGALMLQGLTPGPLLSMNEPVLFRSILFIVFLANIFMWLFQASTIRYMAKITLVPKAILFPVVSFFCILGTIAIRSNPFDLAYLLVMGIVGYIFSKNGYPLSPFILAFILGEMIESNLRRAITYYGNLQTCMIQPSIGTVFFYMAIALPVLVAIVHSIKRRKNTIVI